MTPRNYRAPQRDKLKVGPAIGFPGRPISERRARPSSSRSFKSVFLWICVAMVTVPIARLDGCGTAAAEFIDAAGENPAPVPSDAGNPQPAGEQAKTDTRVEVVLSRDKAGNYVGQGKINQTEVKLLADTGASVVVVPERIAKRIGLKRGRPIPSRTAGGVVTNYATTLDTLSIGPIQISDVPAVINPSMQEDFALLGMSALALLNMTQQDGSLILSYDPGAGPGGSKGRSRPPPAFVHFKRSLKECLGSGNRIDQKTLDCLNGN